MELSGQDYENIYLRLKERIWKHVVFVLGSFAAVAGFSAYGVAVATIDARIEAHMERSDVVREITDSAERSVPELASLLDRIRVASDSLERRLDAIDVAPIAVRPGSVSLVDGEGEAVRIDYGSTEGSQVRFSEPFHESPLVLVQYFRQGPGELDTEIEFVREVTPEGFTVAGTRPLVRSTTWLAVGW